MVWWLMRGYEVEAIAICIYSYIYISKAGKNERNVGDTNSAWLNGFYRLWLLSDVSYQWLRLFIVSAARCFHQEHYGLPEDSERHGPLWCNLGQTKHGRKERFLCWGLQDNKLYKADHSGKLLPIITTELGAFKGSLEYSPGIGDCPDGTVPWQKSLFGIYWKANNCGIGFSFTANSDVFFVLAHGLEAWTWTIKISHPNDTSNRSL